MVDPEWRGRQSVELTLEMDSREAAEIWIHDVEWSLERAFTDPDGVAITEETDMSAYSVAGPVIDNRDGTVTVKMGILTEREALDIVMRGVF
jgi:hypothetical protein